jgi:hypothetical protein
MNMNAQLSSNLIARTLLGLLFSQASESLFVL